VAASKFYDWRERYGKVNEHNGWVPRDFWLEDWEKQAIIGFHLKNPLEGYRRLTFMMLDADIVAVSPSSVWRVLSHAGLLSKWNGKPSKKGTGFAQTLAAHQHWHIDVSYLNIGGTFYYLCSVLDGFSRYIVNWEIRESMTEAEIEIVLQGAKEKYPEARPRIISDNGPQFIAKDFKEFIRISGMTDPAQRAGSLFGERALIEFRRTASCVRAPVQPNPAPREQRFPAREWQQPPGFAPKHPQNRYCHRTGQLDRRTWARQQNQGTALSLRWVRRTAE